MSAQREGEAALVRGTLEVCYLTMWVVRRALIQIEDKQTATVGDKLLLRQSVEQTHSLNPR